MTKALVTYWGGTPLMIIKAQDEKSKKALMGKLIRSHRGTDGWFFLATKSEELWGALKKGD